MKKHVWKFGLTVGILLCIPWLIMTYMLYTDPEFKSRDAIGYAILAVIYSLIFFGIRNYRNNELGGIISFGRAFKTGVLITLTAATLYTVAWLFFYYTFVPDFMEVFTEHVLYQCTSEEDLASKKVEMETYGALYENPVWVTLLTFAEVFPIGLAVSLISALILKNRVKNQLK